MAADVAPWTLAFLRRSAAFLILLPFAAIGLRKNAGALLAQWRNIAILGFLGMFVCGGCVYLSVHHTTASNATLIYTASNLMVLLLWAFRDAHRAPRDDQLGTAFAASPS